MMRLKIFGSNQLQNIGVDLEKPLRLCDFARDDLQPLGETPKPRSGAGGLHYFIY